MPLPKYSEETTRGSFTNLGPDRLRFMNNKYTVTNVALICPASPSNDITMGALTYNGRLNLCFRFYENQNSKEQIIQVCNRIMQLLPE